MRKIIAASAATLAFGLIGATGASADANFSEFCSAFSDFGFSHGACVSNFASEGRAGATAESVCAKFGDGFFANHGQCVSSFREHGFS
jgi:hypothetical protein